MEHVLQNYLTNVILVASVAGIVGLGIVTIQMFGEERYNIGLLLLMMAILATAALITFGIEMLH